MTERQPIEERDPTADPGLQQTVALGDSTDGIQASANRDVAAGPRVTLRAEVSETSDSDTQFSTSSVPTGTTAGRYELQGEIARGGMGAVLKGRDKNLGRELAIKVLLDSHKDNPEVVQRFIEEAQIGGQLQHPGIVPVYELGKFADQRPFFSMKLVRGQTLATLLRRQANSADDRSRFLGIFHQVCQTLAYAHNRGVIHRDLKPANVMVGAFGEVQVMDWGLAKVLSTGRTVDTKGPENERPVDQASRLIADAEYDSTPTFGSRTLDGAVLGTPAYMAPEQAAGDVERLDERADVFGLGAILCEILTGRPPYTGKTGGEIIRQAMRGSLEDCFARLDGCGAELALVDLAKDCLATALDQRPRDAGVVAERISGYLASVETRLREAEVQRAAEAARADEARETAREHEAAARAERHARRLQVRFASVVIGMTAVAGIAAGFIAVYQNGLKQSAVTQRQKADQAREAEEKERKRAEKEKGRAESEKIRADITLADMQASRGLLAAERDSPAEAALWFAAASAQSAEANDKVRQHDNRLRTANWLREAIVPVGTLSFDGFPTQLEFQPQGELLLIFAAEKQRFSLWSWREEKLLPWSEQMTEVNAVAFSPDGAWVAVALSNGKVQIRTVDDGKMVQECQPSEQVTALAFSSQRKYLALGGNHVRVWNCAAKQFLGISFPTQMPIRSFLFNRAEDRLIATSEDKQARVFVVPGLPIQTKPLFAVVHDPTMPSPPALCEQDRVLLTIEGRSRLARWDMESGRPATPPEISVTPFGLTRVIVSPNEEWVATGGNYGPEARQLRDPAAKPLNFDHLNLVKSFAFSPDSSVLLSSSWDQTARLWSLPDGQPLGPPLLHPSQVEHCAWSSDGLRLATSQYDGLIRIWQRPEKELITGIVPVWGERPRISFDGKLAAPGIWHTSPLGFSLTGLKSVQVLSTDDGRAAGPVISLPGLRLDSCVCGDNQSVAAVGPGEKGGWLGVWNIVTAKPLFEPLSLNAIPKSVAARPTSSQIAILSESGELQVFDCRTGKRELAMQHEGWKPEGTRRPRILYSPDGKSLVALGDGPNSTVNVFDAETGQLRFPAIRPVLEPVFAARSFAISADSRLLATIVNGKNAAQVWDMATGQALSQPLPHPGDHFGLFAVCFSPDGKRLLTVCKDGQARYWDWKAGKLAGPPMAHNDEAFDVAITPDGHYAVTAVRGNPARAHFWELSIGKKIAPSMLLGSGKHSGSIQAVEITPDGKRALLGFGTSPVDLAVINLEAMLTPSPAAVSELGQLAELAGSVQIELGDLSKLSRQQWQSRWDQLHTRHPELLAARPRVLPPVVAKIESTAAAVTPELDAAALRNRAVSGLQENRLEDALADLRKANQLEPRHAWAHTLVGAILYQQNKLDEAVGEFREAMEYAPEYLPPYLNLAQVLTQQEKFADAEATLRKASEVDGKNPLPHRILGQILLLQGKVTEASGSLKRAVELQPQDSLAVTMLAEANRLEKVQEKLDALADEKVEPADKREQFDAAMLCHLRRRYFAATRLFTAALAADVEAAENLDNIYRFNAACAAARAAQGEGDADKLTADERVRLRKQSVAWLRADLDTAIKRLATASPNDRAHLLALLGQWNQDPDLASLRDAEAISKLPVDEQSAIKSFWNDLREILSPRK